MKKNHKKEGYTQKEFMAIMKQVCTSKIKTPEGSFTYHFDNGCKLNFEKMENIKGFTKLDSEL